MISLDIMLPYYGDQSYLLAAVASIRELRAADWRLTIIEDAYPRGAQAEAAIAELGDDRIRYLRNERNLGVAGNQHRAAEIAERDWLVVTDFDDVLLPNYAEVVTALLDRCQDAAIVQPGVEVIDERDEIYTPLTDRVKTRVGANGRQIELSGEDAVASLLRANWLYGPSLCLRRAALEPVMPTLTGGAAGDFVYDLARSIAMLRRGGSLVAGADVAYRYRRHRASHSSAGARTGVRFAQERAYFDTVARELGAAGWSRAARAARLRLTSRLNAATQLPAAVRARRGSAVRTLARHAFR